MKTVCVEEFLSWAFVHELPKGGGEGGLIGAGSAWSAIEGVAALGTRIQAQRSDWEPAMAFEHEGAAAPDAVTAGEAVRQLAGVMVSLPVDWGPVGDWGEIGDLERAAIARARGVAGARDGGHLVALVISAAVTGRPPAWDCPRPARRFVTDPANGQPRWFIRRTVKDCLGRKRTVEDAGYDRRRGRPYPGAYRIEALEFDPLAGLLARADYQMWRAALDLVFEACLGRLNGHALLPPRAARAPWDGEAAGQAPRVLAVA